MTDPRIIQCAFAIAARHCAPGVTQISGTFIDTFVDDARACILMWLAQEPSSGMDERGYAEATKHDYGDTVPSVDIAPETYRAMCAQAISEITGVAGKG